MSFSSPINFECQGNYIISLYKTWKALNPEVNTTAKLTRLIDSDYSYQAVRNLVSGKTVEGDFNLFEAVIRAIGIKNEHYREAISRWYPSFMRIAERIYDSNLKVDRTAFLRDEFMKDLYQRMVSAEPLTRDYIGREWGRKGLVKADEILLSEHIICDSEGVYRVVSEDGFLFMGKHVVEILMDHNAKEFWKNPGRKDTEHFFFRIYFLKKDKALQFKHKSEELCKFIDENSEEEADGDVVMVMQTIFREVSTNSENKA